MQLKMTILLMLALLPIFVFSSAAHAAPGPSAYGYISEIDHANPAVGGTVHGIWILTAGTTVYNDDCTGTPTAYFLPDENYSPSNSTFKYDFALIMAAYLNGRPISFYVTGCSPYNNPLVDTIKVN